MTIEGKTLKILCYFQIYNVIRVEISFVIRFGGCDELCNIRLVPQYFMLIVVIEYMVNLVH